VFIYGSDMFVFILTEFPPHKQMKGVCVNKNMVWAAAFSSILLMIPAQFRFPWQWRIG